MGPYDEGYDEAVKADSDNARKFLEDASLYQSLTFRQLQLTVQKAFPSGINMACEQCKDTRTFSKEICQHFLIEKMVKEVKIIEATGPVGYCYECGTCSFRRVFVIQFGYKTADGTAFKSPVALKIGLYPKDSILPPKSIRDNLEKPGQKLWSQGLLCEKNGLGIGAFAYYRQIVEDEIDGLLDKITAVVPEGDREAFQMKVKEAHEAKRASAKIEIVKDLLPSNLRPGGYNPFGTLYGALSGGIHTGGTDEECLSKATAVRDSMEYIIDHVRQQSDLAKQFEKHGKTLLEQPKKDR